MIKYECKRCERNFDDYSALRKHVGRIHKVHSTDFFVEFHLNGEWPLCKCGCNEKVKWSAVRKSFCDYVQGHQSRVVNNWGHNQKAIDASAETRRQQFENGDRQVWNAGLTKITDDRVKINGEKTSIGIMSSAEERMARSVKMSKHRRDGTIPNVFGAETSQWQGGVSSVNQLARASNRLYKEWKYPILVRDGFKCTECPNTDKLHIHHDDETFSNIIKKVMTIDDYENLEEFGRKKEVVERVVDYHVSNKVSGKVLCLECHKKIHPSLNLT
jgi:5-methylcytosine-specific restriction endonuclease McrA